MISLNLSEDINEKLTELAELTGYSKSSVIERALGELYDKCKADEDHMEPFLFRTYKKELVRSLRIRGDNLKEWMKRNRFRANEVDIACALLDRGVERERGVTAEIQAEILRTCFAKVGKMAEYRDTGS